MRPPLLQLPPRRVHRIPRSHTVAAPAASTEQRGSLRHDRARRARDRTGVVRRTELPRRATRPSGAGRTSLLAAPLPIPHERMVSGRGHSQPALTEDGVGLGRVPSNARQQMHTLTFAAAAATVAVGDVVLAAEVGGTEIDERARAPVTSYNCNASARHCRRIRHNNNRRTFYAARAGAVYLRGA